MKCIVGLGNIGKHFKLTRHNISSEVVDYILERNSFSLDERKLKGVYTIERVNGDKVLFIEPMTMMNLSGKAATPIMDYYSISPENLIVLYDDLGLEQEQVRLKQKGGAGGHNGMRSIIEVLGIDQFKRVRAGTGRPASGMTVPDCTLQRFSSDEIVTMEKVIRHAVRTVEKFTETSRFDHVMNEFNGEVR